jgi:hypothetical protein
MAGFTFAPAGVRLVRPISEANQVSQNRISEAETCVKSTGALIGN